MLVHVVADYGPAGDLAFAEVTQRLVAALPGATIVATPVGPFDTLAAGFVVAQLALTDGPADRIVFHNVAPRRDEANPRWRPARRDGRCAKAASGASSSCSCAAEAPRPGSAARDPARPSSSAAHQDRSSGR